MSGPDAFTSAMCDRFPDLAPIRAHLAQAVRELWGDRPTTPHDTAVWLRAMWQRVGQLIEDQRDRICRLLDDDERRRCLVDEMARIIYARIRANPDTTPRYQEKWLACARDLGKDPAALRPVEFLTWRGHRRGGVPTGPDGHPLHLSAQDRWRRDKDRAQALIDNIHTTTNPEEDHHHA